MEQSATFDRQVHRSYKRLKGDLVNHFCLPDFQSPSLLSEHLCLTLWLVLSFCLYKRICYEVC